MLGDFTTMLASLLGSETGNVAMAPETTACMFHFTPGHSSWRREGAGHFHSWSMYHPVSSTLLGMRVWFFKSFSL